MRESDIISIHVPVLPSTINMINRETLSMMKNDVLFTTHSAGRTDQAFKRMLEWAIASMKKMENGERPNNIVNGL
jgi:phosphoglycerate dehydrogenase-like enzyme